MPRKTKDEAEKKVRKTPTKKATTTKTTAKKTSTKKPSTKKTSTKKKTVVIKAVQPEYYDLPYRYNQTIVKLLAQTPSTLFIYWDISDEDRENYKNQYGENFFEITKPVLIVHNHTLNYSFEVEINDFANSWYLHVNDSSSDYKIELGRRPIDKTEKMQEDYIQITSSNEIESPNDHILFDKAQSMVYFRNVKTNEVTSKSMSNLSFIKNMGRIYNIYDLYKKIYKDENIEDFSNPSSSISSQFK